MKEGGKMNLPPIVEAKLWTLNACVQVLSPSLIQGMTLGKLHNLSASQVFLNWNLSGLCETSRI